MKKSVYFLIACTLCLATDIQAQTWYSTLYPQNGQPLTGTDFYTDKLLQDFSFAGYHRGEKPLPAPSRQGRDVTKAPYNADNTGKQDVTAILQQALDDAGRQPGGGRVYLPPGTYQVSPAAGKNYCLLMAHSQVVLSGAGPGKTFLFNAATDMRGKTIVQAGGGTSWAAAGKNKQLLTKDLLQPTTILPVQSTAGFKAGDLVIVRNYIDNDWIAKHKMLEYWKNKGSSLIGQLYCREVLAVNARTRELTIDIPIRYALETAHGAAVYLAPPQLTEIGIADLSIGNRQSFIPGDWREESYQQQGNGSYQNHDSWAITLSQVYNSWIRQVASYRPGGNTANAHLLSNGIKIWQTKNVSLVSCDFKNPQYGGGGGNGYMYRIMGNETLLQDCVAEFNRHGFVLSHASASGNVLLRCLDKDSGRQTGLSGNEKTSGSGSDHHMHFSHANLFDHCTVENSYFAAGWRKWGGGTIHGLTGAHSVYWNLTSNGTQAEAVQTQQGRYGYVIGTRGNKPGVRTSAWHPGTEAITDPVDHVEGTGLGSTLAPQSLYLDQQIKRQVQASSGRKQ